MNNAILKIIEELAKKMYDVSIIDDVLFKKCQEACEAEKVAAGDKKNNNNEEKR